MQTQCPHCETIFRVTENQVDAADGYVRCGVCKDIFNALEVVSDIDEQQESPAITVEMDKGLPLEENIEPSIESSTNDDELSSLNEADNIPNETDLSFLSVEPTPETTPEPEAVLTTEKTEGSDTADNFDFFKDDENLSQQHVVPEQYRTNFNSSQTVTNIALWSVGTLFLSFTLMIEYVWFNRDQFNQRPEIQNITNKLCEQVECENISLRAPNKIELVSRNIYSHPNEKNALIVNVTMINKAIFAQPFPAMQIAFSNVRGEIVAARRFLPSEYLLVEADNSTAFQQNLLTPESSASITLEILDPGKQATTYEFNFL